jgi:hypothetical protein
MRSVYIIFFSFFHLLLHAQVQDDFSDGNFTTDPVWEGDYTKFEINAALQLHLNAPAVSDTAILYTENSSIDNTEWNFFVKMDFSPSASNYLKVYLVSDQPDFKKPLNGYFLRLGEDGSNDAIDLFLQQSITETLILSGIDGHVAAEENSLSVKVTRDDAGNWALYSDTSGGISYELESTAIDNTITTTNYFGFFCKYTSTRSTSFYFDNIYIGPSVEDNEPPQILQVTPISFNQLDVYFTEPVELTSAENLINYSVDNDIGTPSSAIVDSIIENLVHLTFATDFISGVNYTLTVSSIKDFTGNMLTSASAGFLFYETQQNDVVINEIMADPDSPVALPAEEFVELFNPSAYPVDLTGWTFSDATSAVTLPSIILQLDSFLILCNEADVSLFVIFGMVAGLSSFPSLNNDADVLTLRNAFGEVISSVSFNTTWYQDEVKSDGGWSLELIDPTSTCSGINNWSASDSPAGGTPGMQNSIFGAYPDSSAPQLLSATLIGLTQIQLIFDESVDSTIASAISHYIIEPSLTIISAAVSGPEFTIVELTISTAIDSNVVYTVIVSGMADCSGNVAINDTIQFALPSSAVTGDIILNEILFNPKSGGYDYVEIYNNSDKVFDLQNWQLANTDKYDSLSSLNPIIGDHYLFFPGQYLVFTENATVVKQQYMVANPDLFVEMSLPSLSDDEGTIVIINTAGERMDQLHYSESWHFPLIDEQDGVALERISFKAPTQDSLNWHSAASTVGYGTPTYENSQHAETVAQAEISIDPQVFSPDQDGYNDVVSIHYQLKQAGFIGNVKIFNSRGTEIKNLVQNALLPASGTFIWDGITDANDVASIGIYIIYTEVFDLAGLVEHYKNVCIVGGKKD